MLEKGREDIKAYYRQIFASPTYLQAKATQHFYSWTAQMAVPTEFEKKTLNIMLIHWSA